MARASDPNLARLVATSIVGRLREHGHTAYFAGGCVRDALLGLNPTDFDVATDAPPARVREVFPHTAEVGAAFGVVLVHDIVKRQKISVEVATFRSDGPYSDARRPDTVRFSDAPSDAARRDFTINALYLDPLDSVQPPQAPGGGHIIDFVGGISDLRARILRAVGDPGQRLAEDHLRALRAVRFAARLGFALEPATAAAIRRHAAELRGVSRERIGEEVRRMLSHPSRGRAGALMQDLGLDSPALNEPTVHLPTTTLSNLADQSPLFQSLGAWMLDRRVAGSTGVPEGEVSDLVLGMRRALMLSNAESEDLAGILRLHRALLTRWGAAGTSQHKRMLAAPWFKWAHELVAVHRPAAAEVIARDLSRLSSDGVGVSPPPLMTGDELIRLGFKPGPIFKRILEEAYDRQLEGTVRTSEEAITLARSLIAREGGNFPPA